MAATYHPFDKLFKASFIAAIKDLIVTYFEPDIIAGLRFEKLKIIPNENLNADFEKKCPDILCYCHFQCKGKLHDCYIIWEHKGYNYKGLLDQMDVYEQVVKKLHGKSGAAFWLNAIDQQHDPIVFKVVFYHGNAPLSMSLHGSETSQNPELARAIQAKPIIAININNQSLDVLKTHKSSLGSLEWLFKILSDKALIRQMFMNPAFFRNTRVISPPDVKELLGCIIFDIIRKDKSLAHLSNDDFINQLTLILKSKHMKTLADSLKAEGEKIGIQKGMEKERKAGILETAKNMFRQKLDINIIGQVTGLPHLELRRLAI